MTRFVFLPSFFLFDTPISCLSISLAPICPDTFQPPLSFPYRREERIIWHRDDCDDDEAFRLAPKFARLSLPFSLPLSIFSQRVRIVTTKFG